MFIVHYAHTYFTHFILYLNLGIAKIRKHFLAENHTGYKRRHSLYFSGVARGGGRWLRSAALLGGGKIILKNLVMGNVF